LYFRNYFTNRFSTSKYLLKTVYAGLLETVSLRTVTCVGVKLPTSRPPETPRKQDPYWELLSLMRQQSKRD